MFKSKPNNPKPRLDGDDKAFAHLTQKKSSLFSVFIRSARYEGRFLKHNPWDYVMLMWLPLLTILGIWWTFSKPYINDLPIAVIDGSKSSYSRTLIRYLDASPDLDVVRNYNNDAQAYDDILSQKIYAVVIIPNDFADNINKAKPSPVVLKVNAQFGTHSGIIQRGVQTAVGTISAGVEIQRSIKMGSQSDQAMISYSPIGIERISLFNLGGSYQQFLASTVIPALLHILAMIIGATTIGREIRDKTFALWYQNIIYPDMPYPNFKTLKDVPPDLKLAHRYHQLNQYIQTHYQTSDNIGGQINTVENPTVDTNTPHPARPRHLDYDENTLPLMPKKVSLLALVVGLNGKLIWVLLFYMLWGGLMIILALSSHPADLQSIVIVFIAFVALMMISLWLGAIFSLTSYSLRMGLSSAGFVSAPSFAFAGITFPLLSMSDGAQRWANALPLTHYLKVHLTQLQMMAPISVAIPTLLGLITAVFGSLVVTALLCIRAFKHPERWGAR